MTTKHRIRSLECLAKQKYDPPKLTVIRIGDGWVYLKWGDKRATHPIPEDLYAAI